MPDIQRYGEGQLEGDYYVCRVSVGMGGADQVTTYFIDGLGNTTRVSFAKPSAWTPEEIEELPTLGEAIAQHLSRAFDRAEANRKVWLKQHRERERTEPKAPPPMDRATQRFFDDDGGLW